MAVLRNMLIRTGKSGLALPSGAHFTALNLQFDISAGAGETSLGALTAIGGTGGLSVVSVAGVPANVGQPIAGSAGGVFTVEASGVVRFDPDGAFAALQAGATAQSLTTAAVTDGTTTDDALITVTVLGEAAGGASAPDAVSDLTTAVNGSDVGLIWTAPAANGDAITDYVVRQRLAGTSAWSIVADGVTTATGATVPGLADGDHEFSVLAVNNTGTSAISNVASASVSSGSSSSGVAWTPSALATAPVVWVDASDTGSLADGPISNFVDRQGNTLTGQAGDGALLPSYSTADQMLTLADKARFEFASGTSPLGKSFFALYRSTDTQAQAMFGGGFNTWLGFDNGQQVFTRFIIDGATSEVVDLDPTDPVLNDGNWHLLSMHVTPGQPLDVSVDGRPFRQGAGLVRSTEPSAIKTLFAQNKPNNDPTRIFNGDARMMMIVDRVGADDLARIEGYAAHVLGGFTLPAGHPFEASPPTV